MKIGSLCTGYGGLDMAVEAYSYPQDLSTGTLNLWTTRREHAQVIHILASNLTGGCTLDAYNPGEI